VKRKDIIELTIEGMEFGGRSYARAEDRKVELKGGITGQRVSARVKKARKTKPRQAY
jgi:23S rRNA m(5)U-1939 methyltransferase (EC 2.1.1.-)